MNNCIFQGFGHERTIIKSEEFYLNGSMFVKDANKDILKSEKLTVILLLRFLFKSSLKRSTSNEL